MKIISSITEKTSITLLSFYAILLLFINSDYYSEIYNPTIVTLDTIMFLISFAGFVYFFNRWKTISILSFITVVLLNVLTEISIRFYIEYYYEIYIAILISFVIMGLIFSYSKTK